MDTKKILKRIQKPRPARRIRGHWPDEKVVKLISIVELRSELWNSGEGHRQPKPDVWKEVAVELGGHESWRECRTKWQNLRVSFKSNLARAQKRGSHYGTEESVRVHWRFFDAMGFLGKSNSDPLGNMNDEESSTQSSQPMHISSPKITSVPHCDSPNTGPSIKRKALPSSSDDTMQQIAEQMLKLINQPDDVHSAFGAYIAAELRSLPPDPAQILHRRLHRTLIEFLDEIEQSQEQQTQASFNNLHVDVEDTSIHLKIEDELSE